MTAFPKLSPSTLEKLSWTFVSLRITTTPRVTAECPVRAESITQMICQNPGEIESSGVLPSDEAQKIEFRLGIFLMPVFSHHGKKVNRPVRNANLE